MEGQDVLNELLERINNIEKTNELLKKDIENKKNEMKQFENNNKEKEKDTKEDKNNENNNKINVDKKDEKNKKKKEVPTEDQDAKMGEKFYHDYQTVKFNSYEINNNVSEIVIEYIDQEKRGSLYIMGDFTKWEPKPMKKNKDIFSYKIVLLKGFKYYYSFQSDDQIFLDYNSDYQENPKNLQVQNYIDLAKEGEKSSTFDYESCLGILEMAQKNYYLSKLDLDKDEMIFLEKFKRHISISSDISNEKNMEYDKLSDSIYSYYDQKLRYISPYETNSKLMNLKLYFQDRILVHNYSFEEKGRQYLFYYRIINITDTYSFQCIKLYDNNNIKINKKYYSDMGFFYTIIFDQMTSKPIDSNSKLYHLLNVQDSKRILADYNNDKENILKAYFKTLMGLKNKATSSQNPIQNLLGGLSFIRPIGSIIVTPDKVEPSRINANDYEFQYSLNAITKVKNKKEGSYVEFQAIDMMAEKAKKPFRYKVYYSIKNNKINIIHYHVMDKDLKDVIIKIKEIDKNTDPHTIKKSEEHIKSNELLLLILDSHPLKLYYKGKKVKMEAIKIEENKLYLLNSINPDSFFNRMYVTLNPIEDQLKYDLIEQCYDFANNAKEIKNGVDAVVSYDNTKNKVTEPIMLAVSPCLLKPLTSYEETQLKKEKVGSELKGMNDLDKYIFISQKVNDYRKYNKEDITKMDQKEKEKKLASLKEYKAAMSGILNYIERMEMWDKIDLAMVLSSDIDNIIKLFTN